MKTRRNVLIGLGGMAAVGGAYTWMQQPGVTRADLEEGPSTLDPSLEKMLHYASMAPSGHNTQPWVVTLGDGELGVGLQPSRLLGKVDPENREATLSIGGFLENLLTAAPGCGYATDYEVTGGQELVRVHLKPVAASTVAFDKLRLRRTLRVGQLARTLSGDDVAALAGGMHFFSPASREGRYLAEGTIEANRAQAERDDAQQELADWIRFSDADAAAHRDGLTPESMEIKGVAGWYMRHFMGRADVLSRRFRDQGVDMARAQVASYGGWIVVTSDDSTPASLIETGRRTERMWLNARERGIAIHPMTQMLEEPSFRTKVVKDLGLTGAAQFLLRAGYVDRYPEPVSLRRAVASLVVVNKTETKTAP